MEALPVIPVDTSHLWMVSQVVQNMKARLDTLDAEVKVLRSENDELRGAVLKKQSSQMPSDGPSKLKALVEAWGFHVLPADQKEAIKNCWKYRVPYKRHLDSVGYESAIKNVMASNRSSIDASMLEAIVKWDCEYNDRCLMLACHDICLDERGHVRRIGSEVYTNWILCMAIHAGDATLFMHIMDVYSDLIDTKMFLKKSQFGYDRSICHESWLMHVLRKIGMTGQNEHLMQIAEAMYNDHGARLSEEESRRMQSALQSDKKYTPCVPSWDNVSADLITRACVLLDK